MIENGTFNKQKKILEDLPVKELKIWLRNVIWLRNTHPIQLLSSTDFLSYLIELIKASPKLKINICDIVPELLREWGRIDKPLFLEELLLLCGIFRCIEAETAIVTILNENITGIPEEKKLRKRCLSVLSGLGCTKQTLHVFKEYISDFNYAAICYRALYRFDHLFAAIELPDLYKLYKDNDALEKLVQILKIAFLKTLKQNAIVEVIKEIIFLKLDASLLENILDLLDSLGYTVSTSTEKDEEVEIYFLKKDKIGTFSIINLDFKYLWILENYCCKSYINIAAYENIINGIPNECMCRYGTLTVPEIIAC